MPFIECFNPCYVGLWSVSVMVAHFFLSISGFNPCYVGLWSVSQAPDRGADVCPEFQSLLCWIMVCKWKKYPGQQGINGGFNPCYVGLWSVSFLRPPGPPRIRWFQSLLCWIMVCKIQHGGDGMKGRMFQSLLCWIMVCKRLVVGSAEVDVAVSILVMLDYGL